METQKFTSIARRKANRANAKKSTGPRTPEGKRISSLNALQHGLTSPLVVLPTEDAQTYQAFLVKHHEIYLPQTAQETQLVQSLANSRWRLNRCCALEANLFALGLGDETPASLTEAGLTDAKTFKESADTFLKLSLYEQRIMRGHQAVKKELFALQEARRQNAEKEFEEASKVARLHKQNDIPFVPAHFGFVSPITAFEPLTRRQEALLGRLPAQFSPQRGIGHCST